MGEPIGTDVHVKIPKAWVVEDSDRRTVWLTDQDGEIDERLFAAISAVAGMVDYLADWTFEFNDTDSDPEAYIVSVGGQANYGLACESLNLAEFVEYGIPYHANDETKYDMQGTVEMFTPATGLRCRESDTNGEPMLDWRRAKELIDEAKGKAHGTSTHFGDILAELLDEHFNATDYSVFERADISHLHAMTPKAVAK